MAKQKEKLSPVPDFKPGRTSAKNQRKVSEVSAANQPPDLSHITASLRSLAVSLSDLAFMTGNAVRHPEDQVEDIKASLRVFGQVEPLIVNRRPVPNVVIGGNGRLAAMLALGWTHAAVSYVDLAEPEANALSLALNRTADGREWDKDALDKLLREVSTKNDECLDAMFADLARELKLTPTEAREPRPESPPTNVQATLSCPNCGAVIDKP